MPKPIRRQPALVLILAILLAGCRPVETQIPTHLDTATPSGNPPTAASVSPCFESGCHAELHVDEGLFKHEPYVEEKCIECHSIYHIEATQRLVTQSDIELCYSCHPSTDLGNTHPVGEGVLDPNTNQMMTCTSTCHQSHTAPYEYLLSLSPGGELCVSCHRELINP